jgi:hypothetical protein
MIFRKVKMLQKMIAEVMDSLQKRRDQTAAWRDRCYDEKDLTGHVMRSGEVAAFDEAIDMIRAACRRYNIGP